MPVTTHTVTGKAATGPNGNPTRTGPRERAWAWSNQDREELRSRSSGTSQPNGQLDRNEHKAHAAVQPRRMGCGTEWSDSTLEPANYRSTNRLQAHPARAGKNTRSRRGPRPKPAKRLPDRLLGHPRRVSDDAVREPEHVELADLRSDQLIERRALETPKLDVERHLRKGSNAIVAGPPRRRGTAPTDGHRRGPDRCAPRHPGPDGAQDARRDGAAARVRDSPPHRADQRRPAAAQRRYGVRVAPPAPAEGLDLRELGAFGEQPPSAPERLPARPAGWPARSSEGSRRSRNRSETRWGFRCSNRSSTTRATRCEGQRVGAALVAVRGSSPAGPLPSLT